MGIIPGIPTNIPIVTDTDARVTIPDDVTPIDAEDDVSFWFLITPPHATMFVTGSHNKRHHASQYMDTTD